MYLHKWTKAKKDKYTNEFSRILNVVDCVKQGTKTLATFNNLPICILRLCIVFYNPLGHRTTVHWTVNFLNALHTIQRSQIMVKEKKHNKSNRRTTDTSLGDTHIPTKAMGTIATNIVANTVDIKVYRKLTSRRRAPLYL